MAIRVTQFFGWNHVGELIYGASETHWYLPGVASLQDALAPATLLANRRTDLLAGNAFTRALRLSDDAVRGDSLIVLPIGGHPGTSSLNGDSTDFKDITSDQPNASILIRAQNTPGRKKQLYLCGIPDAVIRTNPAGPAPAEVANWQRNFNRWKSLLSGVVAGLGGAQAQVWGFRARRLQDATARRMIVNWTQSAAAPLNLIAHVPTGQLPLNVGDLIQIRNVRMLVPGSPRPIGQWRIQAKTLVAGNDLFEIRSTSSFSALEIDEPGTAEPVTYEYIPYTSVEMTGQRTRKRGVGSLRARGRSRGRTRRLA